ncbi:MAG: hypothetical protein IJX25_00200 [Clostridia bacterium]|nr:hypothetical protein [Clostridia bacterium]
MEKLFKGKYIIVVYDSEGYIKEVADKPSDIKSYPKNTIQSMCSHILQGHNYKYVKLVDVTEQHNDAFKDADEDFMKFLDSLPAKITNKEKSRILQMNERTFYRKKALYKDDYIDKLVEKEIQDLERAL